MIYKPKMSAQGGSALGGKKIIPILLVLFIIFPVFVFAQQQGGSPPSSLSLPNPLGVESFEGLITAIINWLLVITLPIIVLLLLYAGFQFMISGVSPEARKNSINIIKYAIIGYAIMLMAKVLIGVIIGLFSGSSPSAPSAPPPTSAPAPTTAPVTAPTFAPLNESSVTNIVVDVATLTLKANDSTVAFVGSGGNVIFSWSVPSFYYKCTAGSNPDVLRWRNVTGSGEWPYGKSFVGSTVINVFGNPGDRYNFTLTCLDEVDDGQTSASASVEIVED